MMLLRRSRELQLLLVVLAATNAQSYDSEYNSDEGSDGAEGPDYSKYYSNDNSAPLAQIQDKSDTAASGFVAPIDFSGFFGNNHFEFGAASNQESKTAKQSAGFVSPQELASGFADFKSNSPFGRDYFEAAQSKENKEAAPVNKDDYELKPGPSYISHKIVPPTKPKSHKIQKSPSQAKYSTVEVNDLNKEYEKDYNLPLKYSPYKGGLDIPDKLASATDEKKSTDYDFDFNKETPKLSVPYPIPVAKQTVIDPKYLPQLPLGNTQTPYQKYSFQPVTANTDFVPYSSNLQNYYDKYAAIPTYDTSSSDYVSKLIKKNNCKKVNKQVPNTKAAGKNRSKRQAMDCYVCKDEKSGANYEQCSYGSESNPQNYYVESSKKFSSPTLVDNFRYKRYSDKKKENEQEEEDPYEYVKAQTQQYYSKPEDYESNYYKAYKDKVTKKDDEYRFGPQYFQEGEEKSSSELQSEEIAKNGENCNKVHKDGMICMVCKNAKTGGNYEQCAYSSKPAEKKYAYVKEKKYDSNDDEAEEDTDGTEEKPVYGEKSKAAKTSRSDDKEEDFDVPKHFVESTKKHEKGAASEPYKSEVPIYEVKDEPDKDEYYSKIFPEYSKEESKQKEKTASPDEYGYYGEGEKKEVEEVLAEFAKKDRSTCKKAEKNGMTCYQCTDKKGRQHEECMYVSESKPQSKYSSYHAKQESEEPKREESQLKTTEVANPKKRKPIKKTEPLIAESVKSTTTLPLLSSPTPTSKRVYRRTKNIPVTDLAASATENREEKEKPQEKQQPEIEDKYKDQGEEGAFADETKPVYSKQLGFSLPKYMLTKSEGELSFDEFVRGKS